VLVDAVGQNIHLFWVILSSVQVAIVIFQVSVFVLQIVDKWYFMHKAKRSGAKHLTTFPSV
jgi:hypothetical protein